MPDNQLQLIFVLVPFYRHSAMRPGFPHRDMLRISICGRRADKYLLQSSCLPARLARLVRSGRVVIALHAVASSLSKVCIHTDRLMGFLKVNRKILAGSVRELPWVRAGGLQSRAAKGPRSSSVVVISAMEGLDCRFHNLLVSGTSANISRDSFTSRCRIEGDVFVIVKRLERHQEP